MPGGGPFLPSVDAYPVFGSRAKEKRQYFRRPFGLTCLAKLGKILRDGKTASLIRFSVCRNTIALKSRVGSGVGRSLCGTVQSALRRPACAWGPGERLGSPVPIAHCAQFCALHQTLRSTTE